MGKNSFKPCKAHLFRFKSSAKYKAQLIRKSGRRAVVQCANKTTQKRSPKLKWVVFTGQKRKKRQ